MASLPPSKFVGERWLTDRELELFKLWAETGRVIPGISEFMAEFAKLRFLIVHQAMQDGLDPGELEGGDAASKSLIFCCLMDQHINVLARLPKPKKRLTQELADGLVNVFLYGVGSGMRVQADLPPFSADQ